MQSNNTEASKHSKAISSPKSKINIILEIVEYVPNSIVCKTVIKNTGGKLSVVSFEEGEKFCEKTTEYDTFVQIIDGKAEVSIKNENYKLGLGESIVIPVNTVHCFKANEKFKMISTILMRVAKKKNITPLPQ